MLNRQIVEQSHGLNKLGKLTRNDRFVLFTSSASDGFGKKGQNISFISILPNKIIKRMSCLAALLMCNFVDVYAREARRHPLPQSDVFALPQDFCVSQFCEPESADWRREAAK